MCRDGISKLLRGPGIDSTSAIILTYYMYFEAGLGIGNGQIRYGTIYWGRELSSSHFSPCVLWGEKAGERGVNDRHRLKFVLFIMPMTPIWAE